jgi:hypothetical protein
MEGCVHRMPPSSTSMRTTQDEPGIRPALLQYMIGMFALALVCCSLLCIYFYTTPAHADPGYQQANGKTMIGQVAFDETETEIPSPTVTNTPSPTVTTTSTPTPLPSATRTTTPSPTPTRSATPKATIQPSPTATSMQTPSPGATPTSGALSISTTTQGTSANQPQRAVSSPAPTNNQADPSQNATHPGNTFPFSSLMLGLGSVALLGLLCIPGWVILRRRLLPVLSPKLPPSGAAPWSRTRISDQEQTVQYGAQFQVSPLSPQDHAPYNAPSVAPCAGTTTAIPGLYTSSTVSRPRSLFTADSNPPASLNGLPTMGAVPVPNLPAFQKQTPDELSAENTELSDTYLRYLIQLYRERGRL